jgi:ubiquitin-protein ligase E3 A
LKQLYEYDGDVEDLDLTFQIVYDFFGQNIVHNLLLNGANIPVTNDNKQQYIDLYVQYLLEESVKQQFDWFWKGFRHVMQTDLSSLFLPEELELLVCGDPALDFEALERDGTLYDNGFTAEHQTVKDFWEIVHGFTLEQKKRLLFFTTGSDRAPIGGLSKLKLILARNGPDSDRLPTSHTCFNHLLLPEYSSKEKLRDYLLKAISNAEGFGLR